MKRGLCELLHVFVLRAILSSIKDLDRLLCLNVVNIVNFVFLAAKETQRERETDTA